ncbi:hypothetical protein FHT36_001578 [Xanthobacter sp. SG618]|nr:hypothetical protein [Xanthobacter sp. SG618]
MTASRGAPGVYRHKPVFVAALLSVAITSVGAVAQSAQMPFSALPSDVVDTVRQIHHACEQEG